jgi:hypothetical protein
MNTGTPHTNNIARFGLPGMQIYKIRQKKAHGYTVPEIARYMRLSEAAVRAVVEYGRVRKVQTRKRQAKLRYHQRETLLDMPAFFPGGPEKWQALVTANFGTP